MSLFHKKCLHMCMKLRFEDRGHLLHLGQHSNYIAFKSNLGKKSLFTQSEETCHVKSFVHIVRQTVTDCILHSQVGRPPCDILQLQQSQVVSRSVECTMHIVRPNSEYNILHSRVVRPSPSLPSTQVFVHSQPPIECLALCLSQCHHTAIHPPPPLAAAAVQWCKLF